MSHLEEIRQAIAELKAKLDAACKPISDFRAPPPVPTTCCGRGCNGCVWEGYFAAATWWLEEAVATLNQNLSLPIVSQGDNATYV